MQFPDAKMPKPELLALSGGGGQEASQERRRGAGVWSSSSSAEHSLAREAQAYVQVPVSTWNLAGAGKKKVKAIVATVLEQDVVAVQEYPKQAVGWHTIDHGRLNAVLYQDVVMYRAVGVMYDKHKFRVCKRRKSTRGIWILLQHLHEGRMLWVGSVHLPVNEAMEEVHRFTDEFMDALPATDHPAILLGDMNTHFTWVMQQGVASPKQMHSRWSRLRQVTAERGFSQVAPAMERADKPTFVPRRAGASCTQIDGCYAARCHVTPLCVEAGSRHEVGTDHERVSAGVLLRKGGGMDRRARHSAGGPRRVVTMPEPQSVITDDILRRLAIKHTRPASLGPRFRMSADTRRLQVEAKTSKTASAWKMYLSRLREEKDSWKTERVEKAARDWGTYKQLCRSKKGWAEGLHGLYAVRYSRARCRKAFYGCLP